MPMHRPAYLAGGWYPAEAERCRAAIEAHSATTPPPGTWRGLIGPHAGWAYSGDCAGRGYRWLANANPTGIDLVVIFGSHRGPSGPNTIFLEQAWDTPLGPIANDRPLAEELRRTLALEEEPVRPPRPDNAVELHLPFIRAFFPEARLLMLGVEASRRALTIGRAVGEVVRERGRAPVFIGSTDLTHYGPNYGYAPAGTGESGVRWTREVNDRGFLDALSRDAPGEAIDHAIESQSACCPGAVGATFEATRAHVGTLKPTLVDHYLSYDVRPDASFVGYASLVL